VCVAIDKIRPCTPEKTLAYLYLNKQGMDQYQPARDEDQQKYVNESEQQDLRMQAQQQQQEPDLQVEMEGSEPRSTTTPVIQEIPDDETTREIKR
jgi:hypothetical protein